MAHALHLPHISRRSPLLGFIILMHATVIYFINVEKIDVPIAKPDLSWVDITPETKPKSVPVDTTLDKTEKRVVVPDAETLPPVVIDERLDPIQSTEPQTDAITDYDAILRVNPAADPRYPISKPEYPPQALRMNQEGLVVVNACVQPNGRLADLSVSRTSGFPVLDAAAVRHLGKPGTRMLPGAENGRPARMCVDIPMRFVIKDR